MAGDKVLGCIPTRKMCCFCYDLRTGCNILSAYILFSNIVLFMTESLLEYNVTCRFSYGMLGLLTMTTFTSAFIAGLAIGAYCFVSYFFEVKKKHLLWYGGVLGIVLLINIIYVLFRILIHLAKICHSQPYFVIFLTALNFIVYVYLVIILLSYAHAIDEDNRAHEELMMAQAAARAALEAGKDNWKPSTYSTSHAPIS